MYLDKLLKSMEKVIQYPETENNMTGEPVSLPEKFVPHFKPGKELRDRVDAAAAAAEAAALAAAVASGRRVTR